MSLRSICNLVLVHAVVACIVVWNKMTRFLMGVQTEMVMNAGHVLEWLLQYHQNELWLFATNRLGLQQQEFQRQQGQQLQHPANHLIVDRTRRYNATEESFKVSIASQNALSIELLDGGLCLETIGEEEDPDDTILATEEQQGDNPTTTTMSQIQKAIQKAVVKSSESPIQKLDLFASHFRAHLTANMIANILQVLPPLEHLQLGGLRLSVQELCYILKHPALAKLTHLALYDLEFLGDATTRPIVVQQEMMQDDGNSPQKLALHSLCLQEVVAVFLRLEHDQVSLDPLIHLLQFAPSLKHLELVMDHNHAYQHGHPRVDQPQPQHHQQRSERIHGLFIASVFEQMLAATSQQLKTLILEYVPLHAQHFAAVQEHATSLKQLRLRDEPDTTTSTTATTTSSNSSSQQQNNNSNNQRQENAKSLACLLRHHGYLETVGLDGLFVTTHQESSLVFQGLARSSSIISLRLRSLPMDLDDLTTLLSPNPALRYLSLHNINFEHDCHSHNTSFSTTSSIRPTNNRIHNDEPNITNNHDHKKSPDLMEEAVFSRLVQILKDHNNTTLRRLSWKQAEFRRTEVFPRRRKPKAYRCFQLQQSQQQSQRRHHTQRESLYTAQRQLHWYLTLNQRGIRNLMVDTNRSRKEFLDILLEQQQQPLWQHSLMLDSQPQNKQKQGQHQRLQRESDIMANGSKSSELDGYALDCIFFMLADNPTFCDRPGEL